MRDENRIEIKASRKFPRKLIVSLSAGDYIYAQMFTEDMRQFEPVQCLAFASAKLADCHIAADHRDDSVCLWLGSTAFDMSPADAAALAEHFNVAVRLHQDAAAAPAVQS